MNEAISANDSQSSVVTSHSEELRKLLHSIETMEQRYQQVNDYTATLYKRERIHGRLQPLETISVKFKKPYQIYMYWEKGPHQDQELIYRRGWNDNKMRVHPGSFPDVTVDLDIHSRLAKKGNRHTVDQADLGFTIRQIHQDVRRSQQRPQDKIQIKDLGAETVHGTVSHCWEMSFETVGSSPYYASRAQICVADTIGLPNLIRIWDENQQLVEEYSYKNLRTNVGLNEKDFDPNHSAYHF